VVVAHTADLALLRVDWTPTIAGFENPNGLERAVDGPFFWMGGNPTILHVVAPADGCAVLRARWLLGPSRPDLPYRHLTLATQGDSAPQRVLVKDGVQELHFRTARGLNHVSLAVEEKATVLLPSDKRPLLLRVDYLSIEPDACQNNSK